MKLACCVEVERHCVELKASLALKSDRSVFKARRKKQDARSQAPRTNVNDDWTLTIT